MSLTKPPEREEQRVDMTNNIFFIVNFCNYFARGKIGTLKILLKMLSNALILVSNFSCINF